MTMTLLSQTQKSTLATIVDDSGMVALLRELAALAQLQAPNGEKGRARRAALIALAAEIASDPK